MGIRLQFVQCAAHIIHTIGQLIANLSHHFRSLFPISGEGQQGGFRHHFGANQSMPDIVMKLSGDTGTFLCLSHSFKLLCE
ncbi:hypothetical protein D3C76_1418560 [compost metagenome]